MRATLYIAIALTAMGLAGQGIATVQPEKEKSKDTNPFDPLKLMQTPPAPPEKAEPDKLKQRSIYRIEGVRFQKFVSNYGTVFIESPSSVPDFERGRVLCPGEMSPSWEVIRIRDEENLAQDVAGHEKTILGHIEKCEK